MWHEDAYKGVGRKLDAWLFAHIIIANSLLQSFVDHQEGLQEALL